MQPRRVEHPVCRYHITVHELSLPASGVFSNLLVFAFLSRLFPPYKPVSKFHPEQVGHHLVEIPSFPVRQLHELNPNAFLRRSNHSTLDRHGVIALATCEDDDNRLLNPWLSFAQDESTTGTDVPNLSVYRPLGGMQDNRQRYVHPGILATIRSRARFVHRDRILTNPRRGSSCRTATNGNPYYTIPLASVCPAQDALELIFFAVWLQTSRVVSQQKSQLTRLPPHLTRPSFLAEGVRRSRLKSLLYWPYLYKSPPGVQFDESYGRRRLVVSSREGIFFLHP